MEAEMELGLEEDEAMLLVRLTRDMRDAAGMMSPLKQRVMVDLYYQIQNVRLRAFNQLRASAGEEPNAFVTMLSAYMVRMERFLVGALDAATDKTDVGRWAKAQFGVGPIIAAGLSAYVDITQTPTPSALLSFAGLNPDRRWIGREEASRMVESAREEIGAHAAPADLIPFLAEKAVMRADALLRIVQNQATMRTEKKRGSRQAEISFDDLARAMSKRPWNAKLKQIAFKLGDSFVKFHNKDGCVYGHIYAARKLMEIQRNDEGRFAEQAEASLQKRWRDDSEALHWYQGCYPAGTTARAVTYRTQAERQAFLAKVRLKPGEGQRMLPLGRLELRARRIAVKFFLCNYHTVAYESHYQKQAPKPYIFAAQPELHTKYMPPPGWESPAAA